VELLEETGSLVSYRIKPNFKLLGPRFGPQVNAVARALQGADAAELARKRAAGEHVALVVGGLEVDIPSEEYDVETTAAEGFEVVEESGFVVALDTRLTPELVEEGMARELVRRVNDMRKDAGFRVEDRIVTYYAGPESVQEVFNRFADYIRQETLSVRLEPGAADGAAAHAERVTLDGVSVELAVQRV
jgi:isoleucyl-tRNA synthetase